MSEEKSELPPVVWSKRGDVYSEEEADKLARKKLEDWSY